MNSLNITAHYSPRMRRYSDHIKRLRQIHSMLTERLHLRRALNLQRCRYGDHERLLPCPECGAAI